jgi:hypothetical protein
MPNGLTVATVRRITFLVLSGALTIGAVFHWHDIYHDGFLPYKAAPFAINIFWTMLAFVDVLTAYLLIRQRKLGLILALVIMTMDVGINLYAAYESDLFPAFWPLQLQTLFLGFVLGSAGFLWPNPIVIVDKAIRGPV